MEQNGIKHVEDAADNQKLDDKAIMAVLTCIVRQERFCDGLILSCLENGTIQNLLKRLKDFDEQRA